MNFSGKKLLITGGTGSFGNAVLAALLDSSLEEIRVFSRDENKQDDMRRYYQAQFPDFAAKLKFHIGDVRDMASVREAVAGADYIFHAAALKQVSSCETFPLEATKTNVFGTENVLSAAIDYGVQKVVCLSTDKAVYPISAMGASKAMMEKLAIAKARTAPKDSTIICITRYGNVLYSRSSVVPLFVQQAKEGRPFTLTDGSMTRFIMSFDEAVGLVSFAFENAKSGDIVIQKAPACSIDVLAQAVAELFDVPLDIDVIGARPGEKHHETLLTCREGSRAENVGSYYRVPMDGCSLNYAGYINQNKEIQPPIPELNSSNTDQLSVEQVKARLLELPEIRAELEGDIVWKE